MVGSALLKLLKEDGYQNILKRTHSELDLIDQKRTLEFFKSENPDYVFLLAAKVGGIKANDKYRGQFIYENLMIQNNVIHQSFLFFSRFGRLNSIFNTSVARLFRSFCQFCSHWV